MTRETLEAILVAAPGVAKAGDGAFTVDAEHRCGAWLVLGDGATMLGEIVRIQLGVVVRLEQKDRTVTFVEPSAVQGLSVKPPRASSEPARTGF